jgi:tRNA/tmRNA/rRNA uracil-C5-methylase (TrmA/RlmC/RlmD family)
VAHGGHCVARHEGRVVFVRHALPGEAVLARLTEAAAGASYWRADAVEILTPSSDRVPAPCPWAGPGRCGGCDWQHATPAAQRELKAAVLTEQLTRLARLEPGRGGVPAVVVEEVPGAEPDGLGWRTRVRFAVDAEGRPGLRQHRSHAIVPIDRCLIAHPKITILDVASRLWRGAAGLEVVAPATGDERLLVVESGSVPGAGDDDPRAGGAADERRPARPVRRPPAARIRLPKPVVPPGVEASVATLDEEGLHRVRGRTWVSETVPLDGHERRFRVTGTGFWQVHPGAARTLLAAVLTAADPRAGERVVDLYSGVGLFAAGLGERVGPAGTVVAVESSARAGADGRRSLRDLPWVRFETGQVERALPRLAAPGGPLAAGADVVVLDPPRSGAGASVMRRIAALAPRVVVYVACDPAALARDLRTAAEEGYRLTGLRAFDLFPMTHHLECVATLVAVD